MNTDTTSTKKVIVLGAGVIGLTTALKLQETGRYQVEIVADVLPTDPKNINYTSQWAGAYFISTSPAGTEQADIDHKAFLEFWRLSAPGGDAEHCFLRIPQTVYYFSEQPPSNALERMPSYQEVSKNDLKFNQAKCGCTFQTVTIDVPQYLNYLYSRFLSKGGRVTRAHIQHIDQVLEAGAAAFQKVGVVRRNEPLAAPDAVIVCVGLGAKSLGGVEDHDVYPVRGQTVILRAPWVRFGATVEGESEWTYIIPRRSGNVVIGGTVEADDWYPKARAETTADILQRGLKLCPELVPPEVRASKESPDVQDLHNIIVEEACGLRPMRKGGPRIALAPPVTTPKGKKIAVVYNYGHGAKGYIGSIGSADVAINLLESELNRL